MLEFDYGKLKDIRKQHRLRQAEVAKMMCCTGPCISKAELGQSEMTASDLARFADLIGIENMNQFFVKAIGGKENE